MFENCNIDGKNKFPAVFLCFNCCTDERLPTIKQCPHSTTLYVNVDDIIEAKADKAIATGGKHIVTDFINPNNITFSKNHLYEVINLKQEATDDQGFKAICSFQYLIRRELYYMNMYFRNSVQIYSCSSQ